MKTQGKITIAIVGAIAAGALLYVGASAWLGGQVERRYENSLLTALPLIDAAGTSTRSYRRGLFSSEATLSLSLPGVQNPMTPPDAVPGAAMPPTLAPLRVNIVSRIQHGPLAGWRPAAAKIETRIASVEGGNQKLRGLFDGVATPVVAVVASFSGAWDGRLDWPAGHMGDDVASARWGALTYQFNGSADGKHIQGALAWSDLRLDIARPAPASPADDPALAENAADLPMHLALLGLNATFRSERQTIEQPWLLATGHADGSLDSLNIVRGDVTKQPLLSLEAVKLQSDTRVSADQQIDVVQSVTGKGSILNTAIDTLRYEVALERIDGAALLSLQKAVSAMPGVQPAYGAPGASSEAVLTTAIAQALAQLIASGPSYRVQVDATIGGQAGQAKAHLGLLPAAAGQALPTALPPATLLLLAAQQLDGSVSMRFPKTWPALFLAGETDPAASAAAVDQTLSLMEAQGLLKTEGTTYGVDLLYSKGETKVNGQSLLAGLAPELDAPSRGSGAPRRRGRATLR